MAEKNIDLHIESLGITLPPSRGAQAVYKPMVIAGNMLYVSGNVPIRDDGSFILGRAGDTMTEAEAQAAARQVGLCMLGNMKGELGSLNRVAKLVKTLGMVNCTPDFPNHPEVINGFSELMVEVFGEENGKGARSAVGTMLPRGVAVEIEAIFELKE